MQKFFLLLLLLILHACDGSNKKPLKMNDLKMSKIDLKSHDYVMEKLQEYASNSDNLESFAKKIDSWFTLESKVYFSTDLQYGSGVIADRLIEIDDEKKKSNYLLKPINKDPFTKEVFGSWKVDREGVTYMVSVFVEYELK